MAEWRSDGVSWWVYDSESTLLVRPIVVKECNWNKAQGGLFAQRPRNQRPGAARAQYQNRRAAPAAFRQPVASVTDHHRRKHERKNQCHQQNSAGPQSLLKNIVLRILAKMIQGRSPARPYHLNHLR